MSLKFVGVTQRLLTNRRQPISQPKVRSTTQRFLSNTKHERLLWSQHHLLWSNGRSPSPRSGTVHSHCHHRPRWLSNETHAFLPICFTFWSTCLPPERSPKLAAVTNTRITNPNVSTVRNRLRPCTIFPASNPTASLTIAAMRDTRAINNRF